jgi:AcrR family transcriptional regulator
MSTEYQTRWGSARPRLSPDFVDSNRCRRYVDAAAEILHEFGRPGLTTTNLVRLAGGSRGTFYQLFSSVDDCLFHGVALADAELFSALDGLRGDGEWLSELNTAIEGFYEAVAAQPLLAELFLIHSARVSTDAFHSCGDRFLTLLRRGRAAGAARNRRPPSPAIEEAVARAIVVLAARRVREPGLDGLPNEGRSICALVGSLYLGREEALKALGLSLGRTQGGS